MSDAGDDASELPPTVASGAVNVADPKTARRARRKVDREEDERLEFWGAIFSSPIGRREMWGILQSGHAFEEKFPCGPTGFPSPQAGWCEAGEQRLAFRIYLSWLRLAPDGVGLMLTENHPALAPVKPNRG